MNKELQVISKRMASQHVVTSLVALPVLDTQKTTTKRRTRMSSTIHSQEAAVHKAAPKDWSGVIR
eukprot:CAMPEP_0119374402 /NCGR_PEP_ID=MMETSP1334-20130426/30578_1 /TAXON_ID=127549 /ORGANISM="Calcidiscus leptoporus, Strain RCC1130" /LENGTH=64 /DNA_ID=CAMNT_0007392461 /DNA_START=216 /DNA_END=407 /DNA_ORIENTATION=+